jgi:hypothetical protein
MLYPLTSIDEFSILGKGIIKILDRTEIPLDYRADIGDMIIIDEKVWIVGGIESANQGTIGILVHPYRKE